jgi:hypothetical protein
MMTVNLSLLLEGLDQVEGRYLNSLGFVIRGLRGLDNWGRLISSDQGLGCLVKMGLKISWFWACMKNVIGILDCLILRM